MSRGVLHELDDGRRPAERRLRSAAPAGRRVRARFPALLLGRLPPAAALYHAIGGARPTLLLDQALGLTRNTIDVAAQIIVVVALSAYWSASREAFERLWLSLVPAPQRPRARDVWRAVERAVGSHVRGELAVSVLSVLVLAVMFRLARLPLPMLPALAAGVLRLVPFFGVPLAAGAAFLAGSTVGLAAGGGGGRRHRAGHRRARPDRRAPAARRAASQPDADRAAGRRAGRRLRRHRPAVRVDAGDDDRGRASGACIMTHPQAARREQTLAQLRERIEGARRRLLLLPEPNAIQLGGVVARLGALTADAESQLR